MITRIGAWLYQFLRKTQKYTGTDNVYLAKGGFLLTSGQAVSMAIAFLSAVAFANLLDPTTYGNYKYILSLLGVLAVFSLDGVGAAVIQAAARGLEGSFYSGFKIKIKWGLLGSLIAIGAAFYYWSKGNNILPIPLFIAAIFLPLMYASQIYGFFLNGRKLFGVQTAYGIINQIISTGVILAALFLTKNLFWLIAVYFASRTFLSYFFYLLTKTKFHPNKEEDPKTIGYAKHLSLMSVMNYITLYLDKILLFNFMGPGQLAIYSFAVLIPEQINAVLGNINTLAVPKLAQKSREEIRANLIKKVLKLTFITISIIALYIIISPYFFKIFFPKYLNSVLYSQLFILTLISFPASIIGAAFQAKMMKKELYISKILVHSSRIILFSILIPIYGIWGIVTAEMGVSILSLFLSLFLFRKF